MLYHLKIWQRTIDFKQKYILVFLSIVIFIFIQGYLLLRLKSDRFYLKAKGYISQLEDLDKHLVSKRASLYNKALEQLNRAIQFHPLDSRYYFEYTRTFLNILQEEDMLNLLKQAKTKTPLEVLENIHSYIVKAVRLEPLNSRYHLSLAYLYGLRADDDRTEEEFKKAYLLDPHNVDNIIYIIRYFLNNNLPDKVIHYLYKVEFICKEISYSLDSCREILQLKEKLP